MGLILTLPRAFSHVRHYWIHKLALLYSMQLSVSSSRSALPLYCKDHEAFSFIYRMSQTLTKKEFETSRLLGYLIQNRLYGCRFQHKLVQIVRAERGENFVTRLHKGQVTIIPWPVIESPGFYNTFEAIKLLLQEKPTKYTHAGIFLHILKMLMAKLKVSVNLQCNLKLSCVPGKRLGSLRLCVNT